MNYQEVKMGADILAGIGGGLEALGKKKEVNPSALSGDNAISPFLQALLSLTPDPNILRQQQLQQQQKFQERDFQSKDALRKSQIRRNDRRNLPGDSLGYDPLEGLID